MTKNGADALSRRALDANAHAMTLSEAWFALQLREEAGTITSSDASKARDLLESAEALEPDDTQRDPPAEYDDAVTDANYILLSGPDGKRVWHAVEDRL